MWRVTVLLGVCACGRIGFDPIDDNTVSDAPADSMTQQIAQQHYLKASNPGLADGFGNAIALSADASTLVVAASNEAGGSIGINGDQSDDSAGASGAVYVFVRSGAGWVQQAYLKASNTNNSDAFGRDVSLSADGSTLAVGADLEDSAATGIDGNQADNSAMNAGAAYVFTRTGTTWSQQAYVKASNTGPTDSFGYRIALSGDGNTLAVGAHTEDGGATGINGPQNDAVMNSGAVYVYSRTGTVWTQQAYVKASNPDVGEAFGFSLALSHDGSLLGVGACYEDSAATGINGDQTDTSAASAGAAYVFARTGTTWTQQAYLKASNAAALDELGRDLALSADGSTLVVGAWREQSAATGVDGDQGDNSLTNAGAAYVFTRVDAAWSQQAYLKASNPDAEDLFSWRVAIARDGSTIAVTTPFERSPATGVDGAQTLNTAPNAGAVYRFHRSGTSWTQDAYVKASNTNADDWFGEGVALSGDGRVLAVGARAESSGAAGLDGDQLDNSVDRAGAVYIYE